MIASKADQLLKYLTDVLIHLSTALHVDIVPVIYDQLFSLFPLDLSFIVHITLVTSNDNGHVRTAELHYDVPEQAQLLKIARNHGDVKNVSYGLMETLS